MSALKKLLSQTVLYGLSSIVGRALNFLLVPFYTAVLLPEEFGIFTELYAYAAFFNVLYVFGMETAYFRFASKSKNEKETYNNATSFVFCISAGISALLILFSQPIAQHLLHYPERASYVVWMALILFVDGVTAIPFARLRYEKRAAKFAFAKVLNIILNIFFNIAFLVICRKILQGELLSGIKAEVAFIYNPAHDVEYILISNFIANAFLIVILWKTFSGFRFSIAKEYVSEMIKYAYPLMIMGLAGMVNEMLSRILLKELLPPGFYAGKTNLQALGIFGACYKLSMFMTLAVQSFRYAADPFFFSQAEDKNAPALFAKVMKWFVIACLLIFLLVSSNLGLFGLILRNPVYREGLLIVPILLMANLFLGVYYNLSIWYKLTDKTYYGTFISIGGAVVTIVANFILIPLYGYMGSAWATLICYFSMAAVSYGLGQKYYPIPYSLKSALFYIVIAIAFVLVSLQITINDSVLVYGIHFLLLLVFLALVILLERKQLPGLKR